MKNFFKMFSDSLNEFKELRNIVFCALMAAIAVVLSYTTTINIGPFIRVGFSGFPNQIVAALFGPVIGGLFGGTLDVLKYFTTPQTAAFFPGFTLDAILAAMIYGTFFYKKKVTILRSLIAHLVVTVIVNLGTTTLWLSMLYGKSFIALFPMRFIKNMITCPIYSCIFYGLMKAVDLTIRPHMQTISDSTRRKIKIKAK